MATAYLPTSILIYRNMHQYIHVYLFLVSRFCTGSAEGNWRREITFEGRNTFLLGSLLLSSLLPAGSLAQDPRDAPPSRIYTMAACRLSFPMAACHHQSESSELLLFLPATLRERHYLSSPLFSYILLSFSLLFALRLLSSPAAESTSKSRGSRGDILCSCSLSRSLSLNLFLFFSQCLLILLAWPSSGPLCSHPRLAVAEQAFSLALASAQSRSQSPGNKSHPRCSQI